LALTVGLSACGSASTTSTTSAAKSITLPLANDKPTWTNWFNQIGGYMLTHYHVGFKAQPYASTSAFQAVIRAAATTPKAPPLFTWWSGDQIRELASTGAIANLTPEVKQWITQDKLNPGIEKAFEYHGNYYGVPVYAAYWVIFYNKAVFSKYGLTPPTTWAQFLHICSVLKQHGVAPLAQYAQPSWTGFIWFENLLVDSNPTLYHELVRGKVSYLNPGIVQVMKLWKSLEDDGYFATPSNLSNPPTQFVQGKTAMMLIGSWYEPTLIQAGLKPGTGFGAFIMPPIAPHLGWQMIFETGPIVVSSHNPQKSEAIKVLSAFLQPKVQKRWDDITNFSPVESSIPQTNSVNQDIVNQMSQDQVTLHNRYWEATPPQIAVPASADLVKMSLDPSSYMQILQKIQTTAARYWSSH
jgi:multiple sugar transport system substrate-binding protein